MPSAGVEQLEPPGDAARLLAGLDLLAAVSADEVAALVKVVDWWRVPAGAELFAAGDEADGMYLVVRGRLQSHNHGRVLGEVAAGGTLGETALLGGVTRTASMQALRDSVVVRLPAEQVPALAMSSPQVSLRLARLVAARAAAGPRPVRGMGAVTMIGVVSLDGSEVGDRLAGVVARQMGRHASVARVDQALLDEWMAAGGSDEVLAELAAAEDRTDAVVTAISAGGSGALTDLVLRQMDAVIGVAHAGGRPDPVALRHLRAVTRPVWLVLTHRPRCAPSGTRVWLDALGPGSEKPTRTHLCEGDPGDVERLVRGLLGRSVGVVLGGGGARGFAHIGVLRALAEAGVVVDRVGGSSMGAVMGAQLAMGWTPAEMVARNREAWSRSRLIEPGLPALSLLSGRRAGKVFHRFFADRCIEDLWLDFFCTTVDLSDCLLHIARHGPAADWVRASCTVPGLFPPLVDDDGHLHVDGGMLANVPTDVMRARHPGPVIGVDVCFRQRGMRVDPSAPLLGGVSLVRALRRRGADGSHEGFMPTIFDVLGRANLLASLQQHAHAAAHADLFIAPPVEDQGFAAFDRIDALAEFGYQAAVAVLEQADLTSLT